jgi:hypothetical protein
MSDQDPGHDHAHDHPGIARDEGPPSYYAILEISLRELLTEAGLITADEHRRRIEILDSRSPALGPRLSPGPGSIPPTRSASWRMAPPPARSWE